MIISVNDYQSPPKHNGHDASQLMSYFLSISWCNKSLQMMRSSFMCERVNVGGTRITLDGIISFHCPFLLNTDLYSTNEQRIQSNLFPKISYQ